MGESVFLFSTLYMSVEFLSSMALLAESFLKRKKKSEIGNLCMLHVLILS